jgi:hypothetical protein
MIAAKTSTPPLTVVLVGINAICAMIMQRGGNTYALAGFTTTLWEDRNVGVARRSYRQWKFLRSRSGVECRKVFKDWRTAVDLWTGSGRLRKFAQLTHGLFFRLVAHMEPETLGRISTCLRWAWCANHEGPVQRISAIRHMAGSQAERNKWARSCWDAMMSEPILCRSRLSIGSMRQRDSS